MSDTSQLNLPLLSPSQAQKTVTVNEAFSRLDGLVQMVLASRGATTPPASAAENASIIAAPAPRIGAGVAGSGGGVPGAGAAPGS